MEMAGIDTTYTILQKWAKIDTYRVYKVKIGKTKKDEKTGVG